MGVLRKRTVPHIIIDYSANLESAVDFSALCEHLRRAATGVDAFPDAGIRVRAIAAHHYAIADGNPRHGYIDISVRLRAGRALAVKEAATALLFAAAQSFLRPCLETQPVALSLEMRDIDPALSPKTGTIRDYLES